MEGTTSDLWNNEQALLCKLLQLERQLVFAKEYLGNPPLFAGFVSPFLDNTETSIGIIRGNTVKYTSALPNVSSYLN
jgi:hypothetical protein